MSLRIRVINPNTTASMTELIGACARSVVGPDVLVDAVNPASGPASIETHADDLWAAPGVLGEVSRGEQDGIDGYVVACFGDPGLLAARELARGPVVGIAEAAMRTATYLGRTFSVVTTLQRTVPHAHELTWRYGVERACAGIHACEIPVLGLESDPDAADRVLQSCKDALAQDGSDVLVLGCAGMADLAADISNQLGVPVVDGVAAGTTAVEAMLRQGLRSAQAGEFAPPRPVVG